MRLRRIQLVDDSLTSRAVLADLVTDLGYEAVPASNGEEVMADPAWARFDAWILDLRLPGMSGLDLLARIKATVPDAIVLLVTQYEYARLDRAISRYRNVWFLRKPLDAQTLASVLNNAFAGQEAARDLERMRSLSVGLKSVGRVRDLDQEFGVLLHLAVGSLEADAGAVYTVPERDPSTATLRASVGTAPGLLGGEFPVGGLLGRCVERSEHVLSAGARVQRLPDLRQLFPDLHRLHVLTTPLIAGQKLVGLLQLHRDPERESFEEKDVALAKLYAATAAVALENLKLLEETQKALKRQVAAQRELIQSRRLSSLGQVTAGIAHEIKNPLTVILGNLGLIRRRGTAEGLDEYVDRIETQVRRIHRLIQDLKTVYRPEEADRCRFDLADTVVEALSVAPPPSDGPPVEVRVDVPRGTRIEGDLGQVLQVLVNLLSNAYQAMSGAGGTVTIDVVPDPNDTVLRVRDTGPGIPEAVRARLFEPFFTTKGADGTGLGLWISQTILRSHGGSLESVEHPEGGACFQLHFPHESRADATGRPALTVLAGGRPSRPDGPQARILVVDDEEAIRVYLCELLGSEGYDVVSAATPRGAEDQLAAGRFDLVVLDEHLQGISGRDFFLRHGSDFRGAATLLFTGADEADEAEILALGMGGLIRKPASAQRILGAVAEILQGSLARSQVPAS